MSPQPFKKAIATFGLAAVFALCSTVASHAFTETKVPPPAAQSTPKSEVPNLLLEKTDETPGLSLSTPSDGNSGGTELSIPGVGSIGKLPKLDFGLELLYGDDSSQGAGTVVEEKNDDVLIKGKIRHRF